MSMSRVRSRVAAIAGALPVLLAASPVGVALASGEYVVENVVANAQIIGPNVGFLGHGSGISGTTPLFKVTAPNTGATIANVKLTLTNDNTAFNIARDLADGDGLALYADFDNDGVFDATDKAQGLRSTNFSAERPDGAGNVPIRLSFTAPATGHTTYWVTIRPNLSALSGQKVRIEMPASGLDGSAGNGPASLVSTPSGDNRMVMDSKAPSAAATSQFTVEENMAGTQDAYLVAPSVGAVEAGVKVVFFNSPTDTAPTNILTRPNYDTTKAPEQQLDKLAFDTAIDSSAPTQPHRIVIGDGTGLIPGVTSVAKNNQKGNNVYARLMDSAGNLSGVTKLHDCATQTGTATCAPNAANPANANQVVAPVAPTTSELVGGLINLTNHTAAPVRATSPANANSARQASGELSSDTSSAATKSRFVIARVGPDGLPDLTEGNASPPTSVAWAATVNHTVNTQGSVPEGRVFVLSYNTDDLGNVSAPRISTSVPKDVTRPTMSVEIGSGASVGAAGDLVTLQFSEPMDTTDIVGTPTTTGTPGTTSERCAAESPASETTLSKVLPVGHATEGDRTWGHNNCFDWSVGGASATIRLGDNTPPGCTDPVIPCTPRPGVGNKVFIKGTISASRITDANGNQVLGVAPGASDSGTSTIIAPPARPDVSVPAETRDLNTDGFLDGAVVTFTSGVNLGTFTAAQSNFSVVAGGISQPITTAEYVLGDHKKVLFGFGGTFGTGVVPEVRLASSGPTSPTGFVGDDARPIPAFSTPTIDKAGPQLKSAHTVDENHNGRIDQVVFTFTEPIQHALDHNNVQVGGTDGTDGTDVSAQQGGYRVVNYETLGGRNANAGTTQANRNRVRPQTGTTDTKVIELAEVTTGFDTGVTPAVYYYSGAPFPPGGDVRAWYDGAGNAGPIHPTNALTVQTTPADQVYPHLVERKTADVDGDGRVDAMDLKFSEPIPTVTTGASVTVTNHSVLDQFGKGADGIRLVIDETAPRGTGDTGVKPTVKYNSGMFDGVGNVTPAEPNPVASVDGAAPAIVGACVSTPKGSNGLCPEDDPANDASGNPDKGNKLNIFFSELIANASSTVADYKVEQPQGTDKMTPAPTQGTPVNSGTGDSAFSIVTLTWTAANTLDYQQDAVVRLAAAAAIDDLANPVNKSTQISDVTAFKFPTVDLAITCPVAANPGFCSQLTVNVNTNSSSGVTMWRLAETARTTTPPPPDSEFSSGTIPTTYTFPSEGQYTLYLTGKDAYGRLSTEDSAPVRILKAPTLQNVQFVNSTPGVRGGWAKSGTITDGDNLLIGADAYGTDAAEWATAPTGGGCLAQHMSVDVRTISGKSNLGTVAPVKCDLKTTGVQPFRQMQFPVVKASNTTRYPVGTVLKISDSDPGSMIVDGPGGTYRRKAFISVAARRSWMISDASVIKVPSTLVSAVPRIGPNIGYRDGAILRSSSGYYIVYRSQKRPVSVAQLNAWRMSTRHAYPATLAELRAHSTGTRLSGSRHPAGVWIKYSNGAIYQIVRNSKGVNVRRRLANSAALRTLVPTSHIFPAVSADNQMPVDSWLLGYRDGTLLKHSDGSFSVVARRSVRRFANAATFNSLGFNGANALGANGGAMPRVSGQGYRTGVAIDRYKITSTIIKVTNKAGASATATITPALGGLFGLGTLDPAPAGWDFTR